MPTGEMVPIGSPNVARGTITFGVAYDPTTLTILSPHSSFALGSLIAWSAGLQRSPGSTSVSFSLARVTITGETPVVVTTETLTSPDVDMIVRQLDLSSMVDRRPGIYAMRYLSGSEVLAEGKFELTNQTKCSPGDQDAFVYSPDRLRVLLACQHVSGVVRSFDAATDGDRHYYVELDPEYRYLLTPDNLKGLVVEPVCVGPTDAPKIAALCSHDPDPVVEMPPIGTHVWMEGRYVLDSNHGSWAELHPLYRWGFAATRTPATP